jgi:hypothetical protein
MERDRTTFVKMIDLPSLLIEVAVRWIEIGLKPATGTTALDIDLCINDRKSKNRRV